MKLIFNYIPYTEFMRKYPQEIEFFDLIYEAKYPHNTLRCPKCDRITKICRQRYDPRKIYCYAESCHREFSVLSDTMFKGTHLDLRIWFYAIYLLQSVHPTPPALFLQKETGIKSYHSAYRIKSVIKQALIRLEKGQNNIDSKIITSFLQQNK